MRVRDGREGDRRKVTGRALQRIAQERPLMTMDTPGLELPADVPAAGLPDGELVKRIRAGDRALFEILMRRHNQRLYRVARAVVKDEAEVEDVMQQAYVNAFTHLHQFQERARFST